eukprot:TRINITY_DN7447_c0_g2_i1.p1 TRINITY_DN7447_c0_g2~~TRINITY_DN7447_c0_g2_i1.p1  ORF type:complete len:275 (-),score=40.79 TRINITY_DN7447_c0_g2_i1:439-1188(-)
MNLTRQLHQAISRGDMFLVQHFVESCRAELLSFDEAGCIPLHLAVNAGHVDVVQYLLQRNPASVNFPTKQERNTPLHRAAWHGHAPVVQLLLQFNANVHTINKYGTSAVHMAAARGHLAVVKALINHTPSTIHATTTQHGYSVLHVAGEGGHLEIVQFLVQQDATTLQAITNDGDSVLHRAAGEGHFEVVRYLVKEYPASLHTRNQKGKTPLECAVDFPQVHVFLQDCVTLAAAPEPVPAPPIEEEKNE